MQIEVKPIDFWGEAFYSVFVDGVEQTANYNDMLPQKYREDAQEVADFIAEDLSEQ